MTKPHLKLVPKGKPERHLTVRTVFYHGKKVVKKIASGHPINAVGNLAKHMRRNTYDATVAEVYDTVGSGKVYAVMRRDVHGNTRTIYQDAYQPKKDV